MKRRPLLAWPLLALTARVRAATAPRRVVSLGGTVTEIVYALGAGARLVGVDQSSVYPLAATALPQVGYYRSFSVEGVASLQPDLVLASEQAGPPEALAKLRGLGVSVARIASAPDVPTLLQDIDAVASALALDATGRSRAQQLRSSIELAARPVAHIGAAPRVLLLSRHTGRLQAAGRDTAADAVLNLAGGVNVFGEQHGYKAVSAEAVAALAPDSIVTSTLSIKAAGSLQAFAAAPGVAATPAAQTDRIIVLDDLLLLGFGPRLPQALQQLRAGLFGVDAPSR